MCGVCCWSLQRTWESWHNKDLCLSLQKHVFWCILACCNESEWPCCPVRLQYQISLQEALFEFRCRVSEFNVCIPYSGLPTAARTEPLLITALVTLLPAPLTDTGNVPRPAAGPAIQIIDLLHCLQRLCSSTFVASTLINTGSKFAALLFGLQESLWLRISLLLTVYRPTMCWLPFARDGI